MDILLTGLRVVALVFLLTIPGYLTARVLWRDPAAFSTGERIMLPLVLSILIALWFGLVLAEVGLFSLALLFVLALGYSVVLAWVGRRDPPWEWVPREGQPDWLWLGILAIGVLLVARPAEFILGGSDAGVYVNIGASIARTGGIAIHDPFLQSLPADPARQFLLDLTNDFMLYKQLRFPGFFVADGAQGLVLPQFLHLYPVWLAIFDSAVGPYWGLYATPLLGILSSVMAYFVARTLLNRNLARLTFFLLVINVPQFWFARYPVAEMMMQFLLLVGMYAFLRSRSLAARGDGEGVPGIGLPLVSGAAFAFVFFTRADSILILVPIVLYLLVILLARRWRREHWAFAGSFAVFLVQAAVHLWVFSPDYVYFQYTHFLRMKNIDKVLYNLLGYDLPTAQDFMSQPTSLLPLVAVGIVGIVVLVLADLLVGWIRKRWGTRIAVVAGRSVHWLRWGGVAVLAALVIFAYVIWPHPTSLLAYIGGETTASRAGNLIKFGWYLSPFGMVLALVGGALVIRRDLNRANIFFYGASALFSFFYLEELYSNPHYIYTMRHYIPLVIPLFVLLAARGLGWLWSEMPWQHPVVGRAARAAAGVALGLWLVYDVYAMGLIDFTRVSGLTLRLPVVSSRINMGTLHLEPIQESVAGTGELGGAFGQVEALAKQVDPNSVIIFSNNRDEPAMLATPLHYMFGLDTLVSIRNQPNGSKVSGLIDAWRTQGRPVVLAYGTNGGKLYLDHYRLEPFGHVTLNVPQLAFSYQYMPRQSWQINLSYALYHVIPAAGPVAYPYTIDFGGDDFPALVTGWLERTPGESTRWTGTIPDLGSSAKPPAVAARLRLPESGDSANIYLALTVRAPLDKTRLLVKSGQARAEAQVGQNWQTVYVTLPRSQVQREGDSLLVDLTAPAVTDASGRVVGVEFREAQIDVQPFGVSK